MRIPDAVVSFLACRRFAMAGVSRQPKHFSRILFRAFLDHGYDVIPLNPKVHTADIEAQRCYPEIRSIPGQLDGLFIVTKKEDTLDWVRQAIAAGVPKIWIWGVSGKGSVDQAAVRLAVQNNIEVVAGECPLMYLEGSGWVHKFHGALVSLIPALRAPAAHQV